MNIVFMSLDTLPSTLWARDLYDQIQACCRAIKRTGARTYIAGNK